jgi:hypothetical protein
MKSEEISFRLFDLENSLKREYKTLINLAGAITENLAEVQLILSKTDEVNLRVLK